MRVFVTGASGHIGSCVVPELVAAGHEVTGLARSDASEKKVRELGADVRRGSLDDLDVLGEGSRAADAVIHLGFSNELMMSGDFAGAVAKDLAHVSALGDALVGTGKALFGIGMQRTGDAAYNATIDANPRSQVTRLIVDYAGKGVRAATFAVPPVTHSDLDRHGFIPLMIQIARRTGVSGYPGGGTNTWPAAHTRDVATLFRLALEKAPAGAQLYAATEAGVSLKDIAEVIGRKLGIPVRSIPDEQVAEHFAGFPFVRIDFRMPNDETRALLGWDPAHPGLLEDLEQGHYFG
ncbi:SDR family oxidoreductase [Kineosporia succinea]|uniref:Nucleoside-diphosphate-sugar epimerase n=1 Tax=Kineosporia succinea TaxID=84632 RepID=A0ABT9P203_9ACTN|nr:SDR family oxidoreductase [Kineosporia succinea]MDP9826704.1 nucleoside-diphosphate-sugar epimerase [Kineosporia succinea]